MSTQADYKNVKTVLYERDSDVRQAIKAALHRETFTGTFAASALKTAQSAIFNDEADLILIDIDNDRKDILSLMKKIRHHEIGLNPFPIAIALSANSDYTNVRKTIDSGFDSLLLKPFSMATLNKRIQAMMRQRAKFVVTSDYIGPDRRLGQIPKRNQQPVRMFDAPNPLKIMANGEMSATQMQTLVKESIVQVNELRIESQGETIATVVRNLVSSFMLEGVDEGFHKGLKHLNILCRDMDRRLKRSKLAHVSELCSTLQSVVDRVLECPMTPEARDIDLMQNLSAAIARAFSTDGKDVAAAHSISDTVKAVA